MPTLVGIEKVVSFGAQSVTIDMPAGAANGHLAVAFCYKSDELGTFSEDSGTFGQFAAAILQDTTNVDHRGTWFHWIIDNAAANYTFSHDEGNNEEMVVFLAVWSDVDTATPFDVTPTVAHVSSGINDSNMGVPAITPVTDGAELVSFSGGSNSDISAWGASTDWTLRESNAGTNRNAGLQTRTIADVSAYTPAATVWNNTSTADATDWLSWVLALRPASGGGGGGGDNALPHVLLNG